MTTNSRSNPEWFLLARSHQFSPVYLSISKIVQYILLIVYFGNELEKKRSNRWPILLPIFFHVQYRSYPEPDFHHRSALPNGELFSYRSFFLFFFHITFFAFSPRDIFSRTSSPHHAFHLLPHGILDGPTRNDVAVNNFFGTNFGNCWGVYVFNSQYFLLRSQNQFLKVFFRYSWTRGDIEIGIYTEQMWQI